ncbi:MAG: GNAT family N-acetyltransferase [Cypionkella sp.]
MIRRFRLADDQACRDVFVAAVEVGAAGRYSAEERAGWLKNPAMPTGYAAWLDQHITFVAEDVTINGFMMLEASGYLNMAFVRPDAMGKGVADALYAAVLAEARSLALPRLHVLASRYAQSFFARHGWQLAPEITEIEGLDPRQGPDDTPLNRVMTLTLRQTA